MDDTLAYKSPGKKFLPFAKKFKRLLNDAIKIRRRARVRRKDRARARRGFKRGWTKSSEYSSTGEKNCKRFLKRINQEKEMLFTFLGERGVD